mmetsp:Transcript_5747/g.11624  ORF Transcript_5747/g.11624 Transcript_5747/m.11624 type:complete len:329 (+) Transcript_5747:216-1202(+)
MPTATPAPPPPPPPDWLGSSGTNSLSTTTASGLAIASKATTAGDETMLLGLMTASDLSSNRTRVVKCPSADDSALPRSVPSAHLAPARDTSKAVTSTLSAPRDDTATSCVRVARTEASSCVSPMHSSAPVSRTRARHSDTLLASTPSTCWLTSDGSACQERTKVDLLSVTLCWECPASRMEEEPSGTRLARPTKISTLLETPGDGATIPALVMTSSSSRNSLARCTVSDSRPMDDTRDLSSPASFPNTKSCPAGSELAWGVVDVSSQSVAYVVPASQLSNSSLSRYCSEASSKQQTVREGTGAEFGFGVGFILQGKLLAWNVARVSAS